SLEKIENKSNLFSIFCSSVHQIVKLNGIVIHGKQLKAYSRRYFLCRFQMKKNMLLESMIY
ncbi:hypothetical protein BpHYR1_020635, partial [Brachionus plicatilis]